MNRVKDEHEELIDMVEGISIERCPHCDTPIDLKRGQEFETTRCPECGNYPGDYPAQSQERDLLKMR